MTQAHPRSIQDDCPPPSVVGTSPWPYPHSRDGGFSTQGFCEDAKERVAADRRRAGQVTLPTDHTLIVRPAWLDVPLFTRSGEESWTLNTAGMNRLIQATARLRLERQMPRRKDWFDDVQFGGVLESALREYLRSMAWWLPDAIPRASGALTHVFDQLLRDGHQSWEDIFTGEREAADRAAEFRDRDDEHTPWEDRASRIDIEQMIVASGRIDPFRLRPLVLITENAGRRQWWYGAWGVYDSDAAGHVGELLAIHGKHARIPNTVVWMQALTYTGPAPSDDDVRWYGYGFDESTGKHADVLCAITGISLYDGTGGVLANAPCPPEAFVPAVPSTLTALDADGDVFARISARTSTNAAPDDASQSSAATTRVSAGAEERR